MDGANPADTPNTDSQETFAGKYDDDPDQIHISKAGNDRGGKPAENGRMALSSGETLRSAEQLEQHGLIDPSQKPALDHVLQNFSVAITPTVLALIDSSDPNDPIAKQFVPDARELDVKPEENEDPIGDHTHSPLAGVIHRYPDRVLLTPILTCPVYCRFCFRREDIGGGKKSITAAQLDNALNYIESHPEIWEVVISGGDPLLLSPRRLEKILSRLRDIPHIGTVRIHTRIPVVSPEKINEQLLAALKHFSPVYIVLHANHPREFSAEAKSACAKLVDMGIPMLSQTVLLRGINDNTETLTQLMRRFIENRIKPYYLHHADLARGTSHFRTSLEQGQALMRELRGTISGLCQPVYMLDIPGGSGKSPIGPNYLQQHDSGDYVVTDHQGNEHRYHELPAK
jgi:lysine 2,3-aminomutase